MSENRDSISACLVVHNEGAVIRKCLDSIKGFVDEIIIVHDGVCEDNTLEIAREFTDKIYVREHAGMMEAHLVFAFQKAIGKWLFRIDADEFIDSTDFDEIKNTIKDKATNGVVFNWEMWDGKKTITFPGLQKMCLVRKESFHYCGIPHENGTVDGNIKKINVYLHHRPAYNNIAWSSFMRKAKKWTSVHAKYFFPESVTIECFNDNSKKWISHAAFVRNHLYFYILFDPIKMALGQLKNGLWRSFNGIQVVMERYIYYLMLYIEIYKISKNLKVTNNVYGK